MSGEPHKGSEFSEAEWWKDALGQISWRLHVPTVSYETYRRGRKLTRSLLKRKKPPSIWRSLLKQATGFFIWVAIFLFLLAVFDASRNNPIDGRTYVVAVVATCLVLFVIGSYSYRKQEKIVHKVSGLEDYEVFIGKNGILTKDANSMGMLRWTTFLACARVDRDLFLVARNYTFIPIPADVLNQVPDAEAMMAFIDANLSDHSGPSDPSRLPEREKAGAG